MPVAPIVEDDEDDDEQEANEQESAGKFTEKVRLCLTCRYMKK